MGWESNIVFPVFFAGGNGAAIQGVINNAMTTSQSLAVNGVANILNLVPTVYIRSGDHTISTPLTIPPSTPAGAALRITGDWGSRLISNGSSIFDLGGNLLENLEIDHLTLDASGGHCFTNPNLKYCYFHHLSLLQRSPGFSVWDQQQAGSQLQNTYFTDIQYQVVPDNVTGNRTVGGWNINCDVGAATAEVYFTRCLGFNLANAGGFRDNTQYLFDLACTSATVNAYVSNMVFRDCSFHRALGGAVRGRSVAHLTLESCSVFDVFTQGGKNVGNSLVLVGDFPGRTDGSKSIWVRNYHRSSSGIISGAGNPSDIEVAADTNMVNLDGLDASSVGAVIQVQLNGAVGRVRGVGPGAVSLLSPGQVATPAVPAASTPVTNNTTVDVTVYVTGGTAVAVSVNGTATGLAAGAFRVPVGQAISLGPYTAPPTWVWAQ